MMRLTRSSSPDATARARGSRVFVPVARLNDARPPTFVEAMPCNVGDVALTPIELNSDVDRFADSVLTRIASNSAGITDVALIVTHDDAHALIAVARNGHLGLIDVPIELPWWADGPVVICYDAIVHTYSVFTANASHAELYEAFAATWPS